MTLAKRITSGCKTKEDKVSAILRWLSPGKNIKFGGPMTGSRYGVKKTLAQGFGQCWDFSDCFITLCRGSGVPCRQVAAERAHLLLAMNEDAVLDSEFASCIVS